MSMANALHHLSMYATYMDYRFNAREDMLLTQPMAGV